MIEVTRVPVFWRWCALLALTGALLLGLGAVGLPAVWLIAPMLAAIALATTCGPLKLPGALFLVAQACVGCLMAHAVPPGLLGEIQRQWPIFAGGIGITILSSTLVGLGLARSGRFPGTTAIWGTSPGRRPRQSCWQRALAATDVWLP